MSDHEITKTIGDHDPMATQYTPSELLALSDAELAAALSDTGNIISNSDSIRGIATFPEGEGFVKRGLSPFTNQQAKQEIIAYAKLRNIGFTTMPLMIAGDETTSTLIIERLDDRYEFSDDWTDEKLVAALAAMGRLAEMPTEAFERFELDNGWRSISQNPDLIDRLREKMGDEFDKSIVENLATRATQVDEFLASSGVLSHGDVRGDNFAYDPATSTGMFVDWSWCSIAPPSKDRTELLISVAESGYEISDDLLDEYCSPEACLMLAGYWFSQSVQPPWPGGEHVRDHQYVSAKIAWQWHKQLTAAS